MSRPLKSVSTVPSNRYDMSEHTDIQHRLQDHDKVGMKMQRTLYRAGIDFEAFHDDLEHAGIQEVTWFTVVESFVEYYESVTEVVQLLSISNMCPNSPREPLFMKAIFRSEDDMRLRQITPRTAIQAEEYYDKLLGSQVDLLESKMRLQCDIASNVELSVEHHLESGFTVLQFEHDSTIEPQDLLKLFPSIQWRVLEDSTIEEAFWEFNRKMVEERERKTVAVS